MKRLVLVLGSLVAIVIVLGLCIAFGGPVAPPQMASINDPFKSADFSGLPAVSTYPADDGQPLAYRAYAPNSTVRGSVVLVHGSSASSHSLHPMARALSAAGYQVYALDILGHGDSGPKGHIAAIGQLETDMAAFLRQAKPPQPCTLAGFSSGGGFVLRVAGSTLQPQFQSYLLLSPFIGHDAPNRRPDSGGWVHVGVPRVVGLTILNHIGIRAFNHLPVAAFALNERARALLTPWYDFNLTMNFRPQTDYAANIARVTRPVAALVGEKDEAFWPEALEPMFRAAGRDWPVQILPGLGHIPLTLDAVALQAIVQRVGLLQQAR